MERMDRRKKYTRMVLKDSLLALLDSKNIASITVKELCELADINRSTFYAHYKDQFHLLSQIEDELIAEMKNNLNDANFAKIDDALLITEKIVHYFATRSSHCLILLNHNSGSTFETKIYEEASLFFLNHPLMKHFFEKKNLKYVCAFIVTGSIQMVKVWLENGTQESPEEIANLIIDFTYRGVWNAEMNEN